MKIIVEEGEELNNVEHNEREVFCVSKIGLTW